MIVELFLAAFIAAMAFAVARGGGAARASVKTPPVLVAAIGIAEFRRASATTELARSQGNARGLQARWR